MSKIIKINDVYIVKEEIQGFHNEYKYETPVYNSLEGLRVYLKGGNSIFIEGDQTLQTTLAGYFERKINEN